MRNKYTKQQILDFKESDWIFRRSSGYGGFDHKDFPNDEQKWIYMQDYDDRKSFKQQYERDYKLLSDFRNECLPFGEFPECVLQEFLNKKYFNNENN